MKYLTGECTPVEQIVNAYFKDTVCSFALADFVNFAKENTNRIQAKMDTSRMDDTRPYS